MAVFLEPAQVLIVRDIAPQQIAANAVPRWSLRPQSSRVEPLDGRVAELGLEAFVDDDDVRIRIALGRSAGLEIARKGLRGHSGNTRDARCLCQKCAPIDAP